MVSKQIVVIGAGEVGVSFALLLCQLAESGIIADDFCITLLESEDDILSGATLATNVNHESGYEYLKAGHRQTGIDCIQGGITKRLLFNTKLFETGLDNRYLFSTDTEDRGIARYKDFEENVAYMKDIYAKIFNYIVERREWDISEAVKILRHSPEEFEVKLAPSEISELQHIIGGYKSIGGTVKMAYNYAIKKSLVQKFMREGRMQLYLGEEVQMIEKKGATYVVTTNNDAFPADSLIISAAHGIPSLATKIKNSLYAPAGMYHLNSMLYIQLHPTQESELLKKIARVNFVLQGNGGCMYACVLPPTGTEPGYAAVYFPSEKGNHIEKHYYDGSNLLSIPHYWRDWIKNGLPREMQEERLVNITSQLLRFNPFLNDVFTPLDLVPQTVFNPVVQANPDGKDIRVREIIGAQILTDDKRVIAITTPKWTNAELSALSAVEHVIGELWQQHLPKSSRGFGPEKIDVELLTRKIHFRDEDFVQKHIFDYQSKFRFSMGMVS